MSELTVLLHPDPRLKKTCIPVTNIDKSIKKLCLDMIDTMYDANGVGLAAPQIGILKRIIVIDVGDGIIELINPEFIEQEGSQIDVEGCLSLPERAGNVERPSYVKVKGLNRDGKEVIIEGEELLAVALCHEIDHLNGVLFIDKIIEE